MLSTHVIKDEREFYQLEDDWTALLARCRNPSVFLTFEWLSSWWEHFKEGRELFVVVTREDGKVAGIAPLAVAHGRLGNRLHFLGQPGSDYSDFIIPEDSSIELDYLLKLALSNGGGGGGWDIAMLEGIPGDSPSFHRLVDRWEGMKPRGSYSPLVPSPYLPIEKTWDAYEKDVRKKLIADTRRQLRRLEELGTLGFRECSDSGEVARLVDEMVQLKRARYRATGARDIFSNGHVGTFYRDVALKLLQRGWLDLSYLELNGTPLAIHFGFVYADRFLYYMPSFRQEYASFSPGRLLAHHLLQRAFEAGLKEFDFLTGDDPYKYEWTRDFRTVYSFSAYAKGPRARALYQLQEKVIPALRKSAVARKVVRRWRKRADISAEGVGTEPDQ